MPAITPSSVVAIPAPRRFGIELEFVGITWDVARRAIAFVNDTRARGQRWSVKGDGSVVPRRGDPYGTTGELVSPPLAANDAGYMEVRQVCRAMAAAGATVNRSCGFHVHIDAAGLSGPDIAMVISRYAANEDLINRFMAPSRVENNQYCRPPSMIYRMTNREPSSSEVIRNLWTGRRSIRTQAGMVDRYCAVNLAAFVRHGTIEFRQHAGTMNARKVVSWVRFLVDFVEQSRALVRSRVESFLMLTPRVESSTASLENEENAPPWARQILTFPSTVTTTSSFTPWTEERSRSVREHMMFYRYDPRHFRTLTGSNRPVGRRQVLRWTRRHAFEVIYKYYIRRAVYLFLSNPDVSRLSFFHSGHESCEVNSWDDTRMQHEFLGRRLTSFIQTLSTCAFRAYYPERPIRNERALYWRWLLRGYQITREVIEDFRMIPNVVIGLNPVRELRPTDNFWRPLELSSSGRFEESSILRMFLSIRSISPGPGNGAIDPVEYFALPCLDVLSDMGRRISDLRNAPDDPSERASATGRIPMNIATRTFGVLADLAPALPDGVSVPSLSELTGEENLWLGVNSHIATYLRGREQEMNRTREAREAARVARRDARRAERDARRAAAAAARGVPPNSNPA